MFERWVLEDVEVGGVRIPRGQELALQFAAANRDRAAFDRPDELVLDRTPNQYLSFGAGIHYCLGAPLAKVEFDILFRRLLVDLPTIEARPPAALEAALHPPRPRRVDGPGVTDDAEAAERRAERARTIAFLDLEESADRSRSSTTRRSPKCCGSSRRIAVDRRLVQPRPTVVRRVPVPRRGTATTACRSTRTSARSSASRHSDRSPTAVEATGPFDIVDVFRRSELCVPHAREAVAAGPAACGSSSAS